MSAQQIIGFYFLILVSSISFNLIHAESSAPEDIGYKLCTAEQLNSSSPSILFTKKDWINECRESFVQMILNRAYDLKNHQELHHHDHSDHDQHNHQDHHHHHDHHDHHDHHEGLPVKLNSTKTTTHDRFVYGLMAVFIISALSLVGLFALPFLYRVSFTYVLSCFTAIAIGTLFGDAMFHLLPIVFGLHSHSEPHQLHEHHHQSHGVLLSVSFSTSHYLWKMLITVAVLYIFFLLEIFLHWFAHYKHDHKSIDCVEQHEQQILPTHDQSAKTGETRPCVRVDVDLDIEHSHRHHNPSHHNLHQHLSIENKTPSLYSNNKNHGHGSSLPCTPCTHNSECQNTNNPFVFHPIKDKITGTKHEDISITPDTCVKQCSYETETCGGVLRKLKTIKSTGWMVLFGDSIHNFADGLAISAAFSQTLAIGITTTIAVACHELPHELGDYAVLLQSGFSHRRAILWNFLSGTTAILGFLVGCALPDTEHARQWMFAATIGMFLYIALVDLLPTIFSDGEFELKRFIIVNCGLLIGLSFMFLLALFEDSIIHYSFGMR